LQDRVRLLGSREDAGALMDVAGIYVQPSTFEGLPLALQEALFRGCPCLASNIKGNTELVDDGQNGLLFESGNSADLAAKLRRMVSNPDLRNRLAGSARASVVKRGMTAGKMAGEHLQIYGITGSYPVNH